MYEKILVAVDESEAADRALTAAEQLAKLSCAEVGCFTFGKASHRSTSR